jgi:tetratricopeptide (TPR) repeat protein
VPYIERFNGNICVKNQEYTRALKHYSKALFGLKMLFDGNKAEFLQSRQDAVKYIAEIEIPTCLNLTFCYLKTGEWHYAIKYSTQVIENDPDNVKAYYRRGVAYTKIGEISKAKENLAIALDLTQDPGERAAIQRAFYDLKELKELNREREKSMSKRIFKFPETKPATAAAEDPTGTNDKPDTQQQNQDISTD